MVTGAEKTPLARTAATKTNRRETFAAALRVFNGHLLLWSAVVPSWRFEDASEDHRIASDSSCYEFAGQY
jgi:hypothetical protein